MNKSEIFVWSNLADLINVRFGFVVCTSVSLRRTGCWSVVSTLEVKQSIFSCLINGIQHKSFEKVEKFRCLGSTLTNGNCMHEEN